MTERPVICPLQVITPDLPANLLPSAVEKACISGVKWLQLRMKNRPVKEIEQTAAAIKQICDRYNCRLIINDHTDIAINTGAYGVHLGMEDLHPAEARRLSDNKVIIGCTANSFQRVLEVSPYADYIGIGPYRYTRTKEKLSPVLGIEGIKNIVDHCRHNQITIPLIAIGGITVEDVTALISTGIDGIAVSSAIFSAMDIKTVVSSFLLSLNESIKTY